MKIHIITGHFFPQLHPRAFRTNELALELARQGHEVHVTNCMTIEDFDYDKYALENGISITNQNFFRINSKAHNANQVVRKRGVINRFLRYIKDYCFAGRTIFNAIRLSRQIEIDDNTDAVIAVSTPFTSILGLSYYLRHHSKTFVTIGDSGDPFYNSKQSPKAPWFYFIEKRAYKDLDYLTIPTQNAVSIYSPMIDEKKIKIIPQGFRMDNITLYSGEISKPVKFAYAGVFYWDIRNPEFLFKHLNTLDIDFECYVYLRDEDNRFSEMLNSLPNLKGKIYVEYSVPRDELLYKLSEVNFLINIENKSNTQIPSKLIDYAITERPIFSCNSSNFSEDIFHEFISGDYRHRYVLDKKDYDISLLAEKFIQLIRYEDTTDSCKL